MPNLQKAEVLITIHAKFGIGAGGIIDTLRLGKPLMVVVNEDLIANHQSEFAEELADNKHLFYARPQTLHQSIKR